MQILMLGVVIGMGAAIPIGPVNLEIIRRNLRFGTSYGVATGLGACIADLTYLGLLCAGALSLLQYPQLLRFLGFIGSLILFWFAINIFRIKTSEAIEKNSYPSLLRYGFEGYAITLINPYTVLFWASISSQISMLALTHSNMILLAGSGVIIGTVSWVFFLNGLIHFTRHKLNPIAIKWLNYTGGIILLAFATTGMLRAIF